MINRITLGKLERGHMGSVSIKTLDVILDTLGYELSFSKKLENSFGILTLDELSSSNI